MYISGLRIKNYKSFLDSGEINFDRGLNIVIGPNSAGKTALLETLGYRVPHNSHVSKKTKPTRNTKLDEASIIEVAIKIGPEEFGAICHNFDSPLVFPKFDDHDLALQRLNSFLVDGLTIRGRVGPEGFVTGSFDYGLDASKEGFNKVTLDEAGRFVFMSQEGNPQQEFGFKVLTDFGKKIYRFYAERSSVGRCPIGRRSELQPNASNLAEVLHALQSDPPRFDKLNKLLHRIFPHIARVTVQMEENNQSNAMVFEIHVWRDEERKDLTIPLNECGTGIGQALAILCILVNSDEGRTIIIDEPQSFLHPGAARTLIQIMNDYGEHQYVISTHSPEILAISKSSTITALEYLDSESRVSGLSLSQSAALRRVFDGLGVNFSIFFASKVLWVEGQTEEKAFPLIIEKFFGSDVLSDMTIIGISDTGSLQAKKNAKRMFEIYRTLSGAHALVPPIAAVILDNENREHRVIEDLQRLGGGLLHFIQRRCYENYLLDSEAIAAVANQQEEFAGEPITPPQVTEIINRVRASGEFLGRNSGGAPNDITDENWLQKVDGGRLLEHIFSVLSEARVTYRKTVHSISITKWLLEHDRGDLKQVADLIQRVTQRQTVSAAG